MSRADDPPGAGLPPHRPVQGGPVQGGLPEGGLRVLPVPGIGDVTPGDDLAQVIATAAPWLRDGDVLVVTSKIVSKAEGRLVEVPADGPERDAARARVLDSETVRVVARRGATAIVQTRHGFVMAAAGIDASNVDKTHLVLLPADPDASARALRGELLSRYGVDVGVVISDTMGRAWRNGLTDVALGAAGVPPVRDHRGEIDPYGNELQLTEMAVIDELAAAGELVKGKRDRVPVAVVRGYPLVGGPDGGGAAALVRNAAEDMFSLGTAEARAVGRTDAALLGDSPALPDRPADPAAVRRAVAAVDPVIAPGTALHVGGTPPGVRCAPAGADPAALIRFGADVHRLRAALAAEGLLTALHPTGDGLLVEVAAE